MINRNLIIVTCVRNSDSGGQTNPSRSAPVA